MYLKPRLSSAEAEKLAQENSKGAPEGWVVWDLTTGEWLARPPGLPKVALYIRGTSRREVIDKAWEKVGGPIPAWWSANSGDDEGPEPAA